MHVAQFFFEQKKDLKSIRSAKKGRMPGSLAAWHLFMKKFLLRECLYCFMVLLYVGKMKKSCLSNEGFVKR